MQLYLNLYVSISMLMYYFLTKFYNSMIPYEEPYKANNCVNVYIITGFLGSGKTTLLNGLLQGLDSKNNFVIENEFGQVNIDKSLIKGNINKVFEITNGCLCCNLDSDLYEALDQIAQLESKPDNLFIETTGIADAGNLSAIFREDFVREVFDLKKIICVVDVEVIEDFLSKTPEAARQIVASDLLVLNKVNALNQDELLRISGVVSRINPFANQVNTTDGIILTDLLNVANPAKPLFRIDHGVLNSTTHDVSTVYYETDGVFDIEKLELLLRTSLTIYYQDIFRIKGFIRGLHNKIHLLQSAGKTLSIKQSDEIIEKSHLVFIGRKLTTEIAERLLNSAIIKS